MTAKALCLFYAGDGTNFVVLYNPGDLKTTPNGFVEVTKQIYIPPSNDREFEDTLETFDFNGNYIVKSIRNRSREFEIDYSQTGVKLNDPDMYTYGGFLVWDITRKSQLPIREKFFSYRFTDFTVVGETVWTCSPKDEDSAIFNLSLTTNLDTQVLTVPSVKYLRTHFGNIFLRAKFLNGTVIKVPFDEIFSLPPDNSFVVAYIVLGVVIALAILACVGCKVRERRMKMSQEVKQIKRKKTENQKKVKQFIQETEAGGSLVDATQSRFKSVAKDNTTLMTSESDVML